MTAFPFAAPLAPMEAKVKEELPAGGWAYEPKWDGFRILAWGAPERRLDSRQQKPLLRYFPELEGAVEGLPDATVVDGEVVFVGPEGRTDFDVLSQRIHPADSRIRMLSRQTPVQLVAFDLLSDRGDDLRGVPYAERRARLEALAPQLPAPWHLTPATTDRDTADRWMVEFDSAGCDGIVAKRLDGVYVEGKRDMVKVKLRRSIDCVVAGYRVHKEGDRVGSLLLALYDDDGGLHFVGHTSGFSDEDRVALLERLRPLEAEDPYGEGARRPDTPSRWTGEPLESIPLRPELVCQVSVDQFTGIRFRHASRFERWRPDKSATPQDCPLSQIEPGAGPRFDDLVLAPG